MPDFTVDTNGFAQLERDWLRLAGDLGPRRARTVANLPLRRALAPVRADIERNTPVDTGALRDSITVNASGARRSEVRSGTLTNNDVAVGRVGYFWRGTSLWFEALAVEYGTQFQAPSMVLRDALRSNVSDMLSILGRELGENIQKRAARYANTGK